MKKSVARVLLYSSATYLLPLFTQIALPSAAQAQSLPLCTTLLTINCIDPTITTVVTPSVPVSGALVVPVTGTVTTTSGTLTTMTGTVTNGTTLVAGPGLTGTSATNIAATLAGNITTIGDNQPALSFTTPGLLTVIDTGTLSTLGINSDGANLIGGTVNASLNNIFT